MTDHYREAEQLLTSARQISAYLAGLGEHVTTSQQRQEIDAGEQAMLTATARAHVHATLALVQAVGALVDRTGGP